MTDSGHEHEHEPRTTVMGREDTADEARTRTFRIPGLRPKGERSRRRFASPRVLGALAVAAVSAWGAHHVTSEANTTRQNAEIATIDKMRTTNSATCLDRVGVMAPGMEVSTQPGKIKSGFLFIMVGNKAKMDNEAETAVQRLVVMKDDNKRNVGYGFMMNPPVKDKNGVATAASIAAEMNYFEDSLGKKDGVQLYPHRAQKADAPTEIPCTINADGTITANGEPAGFGIESPTVEQVMRLDISPAAIK